MLGLTFWIYQSTTKDYHQLCCCTILLHVFINKSISIKYFPFIFFFYYIALFYMYIVILVLKVYITFWPTEKNSISLSWKTKMGSEFNDSSLPT